MIFTRKHLSLVLSCTVCSIFLMASTPATVQADTAAVPISEPVRISGTIHKDNGRLYMTGIQGDTVLDELVLNVSEETRILDAVNGFPVSAESISEGEYVYAWISHAMTMSLPPQSHAEMIICQIPADFAAPSYQTADTLTQNGDGTFTLVSMRGEQFLINQNTALLPYLTRNIVTVDDLTKGRSCLIWPVVSMNGNGGEVSGTSASKIVIFPEDVVVTGPASDPELMKK